jgi:putative ABC transport system substrate-binding protein
MSGFGYTEGRDFRIEARFAEGDVNRLASLASEVVADKPTVIVTASSSAIMALKKATSAIPIVFATAAHPVEQGFVESLRQPGGNITGVAVHLEVEAKVVEIVRAMLPAAHRLGVLVHDQDPVHKPYLASIEPAARRLNLEPIAVRARRAENFAPALKDLADRKADAVLVPNQALFGTNSKQVVDLALAARLPLFSSLLYMADFGGLASYGTALTENYRRATALVNEILRGAKPSDLPVEQPATFQLVINLKTAKTIGIALSPVILARADRVIE